MRKHFKNNKGFVALFTVLIAAVVLSMAIGIANISLKQIVLSASSTDANKSFYAADSGIECVLFHDLRGTTPNSFDANQAFFTIECGGVNIQVAQVTPGFFLEFQVPFDDDSACAYVNVEKDFTLNTTRVISRGMNATCGTTNARTTERAIEVTY